MRQVIRMFMFPLLFTIAAFLYVGMSLGGIAVGTIVVLAAIEFAFSFDNAIINAQVLGTVSRFWQSLFLSVGVVIAIFGVRLFLPLAIVGVTAHLSIGRVAGVALHNPHTYAQYLEQAQPSISAFGGTFLLMLVLHFFTAEHDIEWIRLIERQLRRWASWWVPLTCTTAVLFIAAVFVSHAERGPVVKAGLIGMTLYAFMHGAIELAGRYFGAAAGRRTGWVAFATFVYLELLDASLSFDGVIGAFAITSTVILIALGLGIGAVWARSLTVYMVKHKTLEAYRYLEHGAHYAIAVLAAAMLLSLFVHVPDFVTGFACIGIIGAAALSSREGRQDASREHIRSGH